MSQENKNTMGYGLRVKILFFIIPLLSLVGIALVSYFLINTSRLLVENETKRILSLAQNLASTSELGVAAEDEAFLSLPLKSFIQDAAVVSACLNQRTTTNPSSATVIQ